MNIDTANLSTGTECSRLRSLTLPSSLERNTPFSTVLKSSENG